MAITEIAYTSFNNGDTRQDIRTKINNLGSAVADLSVESEVERTSLDNRITQNESDISTLQNDVLPLSILSAGSQSQLPSQTLVAGVPEKLNWISSEFLSNGTAISYSAANDEITINSAGVYKVYGTITLTLPNNVECELELYVNGLPTGMKNIATGLSNFSNTIPYSGIATFSVNDVLSIYITTTGSTVTVEYANVIIEETNY